jgi:undecaprenyl-diphosphatase
VRSIALSILKAIILGCVQGITEFLPISSSGHLSLFQHFLGVGGEGSLLFSVLLHLGTLIAVFIVFHKTIFELVIEAFDLLKDVFTGRFKFKQLEGIKKMLVMFVFSCIPLLFLLIPIGNDMKLMDYLGGFSEDDSILLEGICFLATGVLLLTSTHISKKKTLTRDVNVVDAFAIGIAQAFAAGFPGISRSGSTISTGMICGVSKSNMVEYSFILGIPAILVANIVEFKDAVELGSEFEALPAIIGVIVAAVVGVLCIKLLQWILKKDAWKYFGYYCLALGALTIFCSILGL